MSISENLCFIKENIEKSCKKAGRKTEDITLIGVTKTIELERIKEMVNLGVKDLGENKVQELISKYDFIDENVNWHLIGHLQTNKVKYVIGKTKLIHSVDSFKLLEEINEKSLINNFVTELLIEINMSKENSKFGISESEALDFAEKSMLLEGVKLRGLMTVAPFVDKDEKNREIFYKMRKLFVDIKDKIDDNNNMEFLSMGMTNDYLVAIEEGANMVRIGTGIFGARGNI